nr:hypothetical protein [Tanacetum cinerariifolium]
MSSASSAVTYTSVYTDSEPWRVFWGADEELSDGGSPRVIVYGYDGLPMLPPHDPDFVPEPIYPEYIPLEDEHIVPAEEQPLPPVVSPTAESLGYVAESDPEEDPKEYEEDETEDGPVDYPMDGGDDGDDDDDDSSGYDADDEDEDEEDEKEEEEEHLALADSTVVIPIDELVSRPKGERLARCTAPDALPSPPLPPSLYPPPVDRRDDIPESEQPPRKRLCLLTLGSRYEVGESSTKGRGVDYGFADTVEAEMRHRGIGEVGYGIRYAWIDPAEAVPEMAPTTLEGVNTRVTELAELHEHDTQDLYALLEDAQDGRTRISQWVTMDSQRVDLLMGDRMTLQQIMAPVTRQGHNPPPSNIETPPHHMTPELVQSMIDQALLRNSTNGDRSQSSHEDNPRHVQTTRPCFYADFMKCHPLNFKGNEGVSDQDFRSRDLCNDLGSTQEEDDGQFVANENEKINKYISGLPDNIYVNVKSSKPRTLDETIELTNDLMDKKICTYVERADNKRKTDDTSRNNHGHQEQPFKKQNVIKVYNMGTRERKSCEGSLPKCTKCQRHHNGPCTQKCHKCNKVGHFARDCRSSGNANVANAQRDGKETPKGNGCFKCGASGHFKRDCPKLRNKNRGNRNAQGWVYAVGNAKKERKCINKPGLKCRHGSLVNIDPTPLRSSYDVELADGKIVGIDTIIRGNALGYSTFRCIVHIWGCYVMLGDLNVTLKDLSGTIAGTIHYKVLDVGSYGNDITLGAAMILANVSVITPKPTQHYFNITMRNVIEVFRKDTVLGSGSG